MPKIIPRFHAEYLGHSLACASRYGMEESERIIWSLPLLHNAAQVYVLIPVIAMGVSAVLMPRVDVPRMLAPVSYTHLDVYKRQMPARTSVGSSKRSRRAAMALATIAGENS